MVFDFSGMFSTSKRAPDITSSKMTSHREDQLAGKENVHA
jgi:hypothetical protein